MGNKLFVSSFSYSKIRSELETARLDYIGKINKTFVDIQGQLLGIPVATVIVGSQLKVASTCGVELWRNAAVMAGAWSFLILLAFAVVNQWITLSAVRGEIDRQQKKLQGEYAAISDRFIKIFKGLQARLCWQRFALVVVFGLAFVGAVFASYAFGQLARVNVWACLTGQLPFVVPKTP